jgi:hypothetical protein
MPGQEAAPAVFRKAAMPLLSGSCAPHITKVSQGEIVKQSRFKTKGHHMATKERLAAMAASLCAVCSGSMVVKVVAPDPGAAASELRTYACAECGHSRTYSVESGGS